MQRMKTNNGLRNASAGHAAADESAAGEPMPTAAELLHPSGAPAWAEHWSPVERAEYGRRLKGDSSAATAALPALVRESVLSLWGDRRDDDQLRRELRRLLVTRD